MADVFTKTREHERGDQMRAARDSGLLPYFRHLEAETGATAVMEGERRVMLGSNNYLGLTAHPEVTRAAADALGRYGSALTGSRLLNGTVPLHDELENDLADWLGEASALVFTTGYQANLGTLSALLGPDDTVLCDGADHASILDGARLSGAHGERYGHDRLDELEAGLVAAARRRSAALVAVDGVYSMEGDVCDLPELLAATRRHGARLLVDEAHAAGALGPEGAGVCAAFGLGPEVDLRTGTFSKSLASCGGYVAGSAEVIDYLRVEARPFLFTAASVPAALGAALAALRVCRSAEGDELRERLTANARYLRAGLTDLGFDVAPAAALADGRELVTPIVPIRIGEDWRAAVVWRELYDAGVYVNVGVHPAVPRDQALLRTSVVASHRREHLDRALAAFERVAGTLAPA